MWSFFNGHPGYDHLKTQFRACVEQCTPFPITLERVYGTVSNQRRRVIALALARKAEKEKKEISGTYKRQYTGYA